MKKHNFKKIALLGVSVGLLNGQIVAAEKSAPKNLSQDNTVSPADTTKTTSDTTTIDPAGGNMNYHLMTEEELLLELNEEGTALYKQLSPQGKALALHTASQMCAGGNQCKGLGACADDKHDCAGKNSCEGKGKCAIADKNLAVKLVSKKMEGERAKMNGQPGHNHSNHKR
ncbi:MAG: hypothetical protein H0X46_04075 [Bacteroidetes bacterium]|nr:hypothetical protein [Bacteroidota bacterium]